VVGPRFPPGGFNFMLGVPSSEMLLTLKAVSGILALFEARSKVLAARLLSRILARLEAYGL